MEIVCWVWDWEGGTVWGGWNGLLAWDLEGGAVSGGWNGCVFLLFTLIGLSLSPPGDRMTLPVWWGRLGFGGHARRTALEGEGRMKVGGDKGRVKSGLGFGGRSCFGRVEWLGG